MQFSPPLPWTPPEAAQARRLDFARTDPLDLAGLAAAGERPFSRDAPCEAADRLARFLLRPAVRTFASGELAFRRTLAALLSPGDDVIIDAGAVPAMFETVARVPAQLHRTPPGSLSAVERRLARLGGQPRTGRLFVAVPALAALSSVAADLDALCALCAAHRATLIVDVSQDLGVMGGAGRGLAEAEACLDRIDVIVGDLSANLGATGGLAAVRDPGASARLASSGAPPLLPAAASRVLAALDLIESVEGQRRRRSLQSCALRLRNHLLADRMPAMGHPSPVVPLRLPPGIAAELTALAASAGVRVPLVKAPRVAGHAPRWLIRLHARHGPGDIDDLAGILHDVTRAGARWTALSPA
jgi:glycine C-acetyltransferase